MLRLYIAISIVAVMVSASVARDNSAQNNVATEEIEQQFLIAMQEADHGRYALASERLRRLSGITDAPRIRLERGRVLMRIGKFAEAYELFKAVYLDPNTPQTVKRNILPFLEEAELRTFRLRYGVSVITDSNPSKIGEGATIFFNGIPLHYQPPAEKKTAYGMEPWVSVEKLWENGYLTKFSASARVFEDRELRKFSMQAAVARVYPSLKGAFVQLGVDSEVGHDSHFYMPNIEMWKRWKLSDSYGVGLGGQVGYMANKSSGMSGMYYRSYVFGDWTFQPNATLYGRLTGERRDSQIEFYRYTAAKVDVGVNFDFKGWQVGPKFQVRQSWYDMHNPLFNVKRRDTIYKPAISFSSPSLEWNGIRPEMNVFYEWADSNIPIYSYNQFGGMVNFKKMF